MRTQIDPALCALLAAVSPACAQQKSGDWYPPAGGSDSAATEDGPCPADMVLVTPSEGAALTLGEQDPEWLRDTDGNTYQYSILAGPLAPRASYCVARFPFPGEGEDWSAEAAYFELMPALEARLAEGGRRLCTLSELLLAAAGPDNWRYALHPGERIAGCEPDDHTPTQPIGGYDACESTLSVHDFNVRSSWARVDDWERSVLEGSIPPTEILPYAVYGGTARDDTFYPPTNFAVHFHREGLMEAGGYKDDDLRVCADPDAVGPGEQAAWEEARGRFIERGSTYRAWLE
jgi:hypothetical protein